MFALSRWTSWVASIARRGIGERKWVNRFPATLSPGSRRLAFVSRPGDELRRPRLSTVRDWTQERHRYKGRPYPCNVLAYPENRVWVGYVVIRLPRYRHFANDRVDVYIEFSPPGIRHPQCFAVNAQDDDPASRLALRVRGFMLGCGPYDQYAHSMGESMVLKANTLTDMLLDEEATREDIMKRPRRTWQTKVRAPRRNERKVPLKGR